MQLNCAACPSVAAFPGQLVAVLGRSGMAGTTFHARDFIAGLPTPSPSAQVPTLSPEQLHMLVLSGPFSLKSNLDYSPLQQAIDYATKVGPQVLILKGPFVDANNKLVQDGDTEIPGEDEPCTFEELYNRHVLPILYKSLQTLRRARTTEIFVVPSLEETLCFHPMPQPPLDQSLAAAVGSAGFEQLKRVGVKFLPNPAHLDINGLKVSITSADALSPVLRSGLVLRPEEKKIEQALRLLQQQRTFFPVLPREPAQVSEARAAALDFPEKGVPDICIFPSVSGTPSGTFVDEKLFVNPGSVCRPVAKGTFAEIWVAPQTTVGAGKGLKDRVRVDIQSLQ